MPRIHRPNLSAAATCLRSIFYNTEKLHICLCGSKGIGKTSLLKTAFPDEIICDIAGSSLADETELLLFRERRVLAELHDASASLIDALSSREDVMLIDLDEWYRNCEKMKIGCVLMASGFSTRFSSNKLLADFRGKPIIAHAMSALSHAEIGPVCVVTRYPEIRQLAESFSLGCVLHDKPSLSDTIRLGVGSFGKDVSGYLLCVADQPLLSAETIQALQAAFALDPARIIRPKHDDTQGNPVIFPAALRDDLLALREEQNGRFVIKKHPHLLRFLEIADPAEFMDVDTVETLEQLQ